MDEHARIAQFFAPLAGNEPGALGLKDDAALLKPPAGKTLIVTTDSVIAGIHVPSGAKPQQIVTKLMRRNLSDLAAMGATPWRYLLNLHTPKATKDAWFTAFANTLAQEQQHFGLTLMGGDCTSGARPVHATMTCFGLVEGKPLLRSGAKQGDMLYVSGTIGDAALGLLVKQGALDTTPAERKALLAHYEVPQPRLALGAALLGVASAAIDISDGLLADAARLLDASNVGGMIMRDAVPLSPEVAHALAQRPELWDSVLAGGDDYELCFTVPWAMAARVDMLATKLNLKLTRIGSVSTGSGLKLLDGAGHGLPVTHAGFSH